MYCICVLFHFKTYKFVLICCLLFSDPYCKIKLFRGDREFGEIDAVCTETIKKVRIFYYCQLLIQNY